MHLLKFINFACSYLSDMYVVQVCTFNDGCKQGIDQQNFNRKSISRKITHPQSWTENRRSPGLRMRPQCWTESRYASSVLDWEYFNVKLRIFQDWGCVILREIDFLLNICRSIPCLHPSWKVHTWVEWLVSMLALLCDCSLVLLSSLPLA